MSDFTTDYYIAMTTSAQFSEHMEAMLAMIIADGGCSPSMFKRGDINGTIFRTPMQGGKTGSARELLHFRLPFRMEENELLLYLKGVDVSPKDDLLALYIVSAFDVGGNSPLIIKAADKAGFLPWMEDVDDGAGGTRPIELTDNFWLSHYTGSDEEEL